jgi:hypothetical protein
MEQYSTNGVAIRKLVLQSKLNHSKIAALQIALLAFKARPLIDPT